MLIFRCTERTVRRFKLPLRNDAPSASGVLGDWYVNLLNIGPYRLVLCVSERSLLPVIVPARNECFPAQFNSALKAVLRELKVPEQNIEVEAGEGREILFGRTRNRQVLGVMNDLSRLAFGDFLSTSPDHLLYLSMRLAEAPFSPVAYESPKRLTISLFQAGRPN